jgi:hypothetical protein
MLSLPRALKGANDVGGLREEETYVVKMWSSVLEASREACSRLRSTSQRLLTLALSSSLAGAGSEAHSQAGEVRERVRAASEPLGWVKA